MSDDKKPKNLKALQKRFQTRISLTRMAREASKNGDFVTAIKNYNEYIKILGDINDVDPFELTPEHFNPDKEVSEMLLISQVYWELTKIYDMTPKLQDNFQKSLDQFVLFTINQKYQVVNAELLRKYLKKSSQNYAQLQEAYDKIFVESDKCYIATIAYGESHQITRDLRVFKKFLNKSKLGLSFIKLYYRLSNMLIDKGLINNIHVNFFKSILAPTHKIIMFSRGLWAK